MSSGGGLRGLDAPATEFDVDRWGRIYRADRPLRPPTRTWIVLRVLADALASLATMLEERRPR